MTVTVETYRTMAVTGAGRGTMTELGPGPGQGQGKGVFGREKVLTEIKNGRDRLEARSLNVVFAVTDQFIT